MQAVAQFLTTFLGLRRPTEVKYNVRHRVVNS